MDLARCGCNIACLDVDLQATEELCTELKRLGVNAKGYQVDVTSYNELENVKKQINADLGIVDIIVNNAGLIPKNSFQDGDASDIRRVMSVKSFLEFINSLEEKLTATSLERFGLLTPEYVAAETVRALRSGERYCTVPRFYLFLVTFFQSIPCKSQDFADDIFIPHIRTSNANHTTPDTGYKKPQ